MRLVLGLAAACLPLLAAPAFANCADEIQSTMARFAEARPVSIVSTMQSKHGVTKIVTEMTTGGMHSWRDERGVVSEYTLLGDRAWSKEGGRWVQLPAERTDGFAAAANSETSTPLEQMGDYECLGTDMQTSLQSYRFSFFDSGAKVRAALQADPELELPMVMQTWSTGIEKTSTISRLSYDAGITVKAPVGFSAP